MTHIRQPKPFLYYHQWRPGLILVSVVASTRIETAIRALVALARWKRCRAALQFNEDWIDIPFPDRGGEFDNVARTMQALETWESLREAKHPDEISGSRKDRLQRFKDEVGLPEFKRDNRYWRRFMQEENYPAGAKRLALDWTLKDTEKVQAL